MFVTQGEKAKEEKAWVIKSFYHGLCHLCGADCCIGCGPCGFLLRVVEVTASAGVGLVLPLSRTLLHALK